MIPFRVAAALLYVADDAAEDPLVSVGFHIDFDVQEAADPLVGEKQDALNEDDRSRGSILMISLDRLCWL